MGESEMKNIVRRAATAVIFALTSSAAGAADNTWNGAYAGFNAGQASSRSCSSWSAGNTSQISGELALAYAPDCGSHGAFLGGGQIGDNFQAGRVAWGIEAAFDIWEGSRTNQSATLGPSAIAGGAPAGTYSFTSRRNPDAIGMFTGRIGYSGNQWFPYLKAGALLAGGSQSDKLSYVPASGTAATASFTGAKSFASTGWVGRRRRRDRPAWLMVHRGRIPSCEPRQGVELGCRMHGQRRELCRVHQCLVAEQPRRIPGQSHSHHGQLLVRLLVEAAR
jgi:hypothetical protein